MNEVQVGVSSSLHKHLWFWGCPMRVLGSKSKSFYNCALHVCHGSWRLIHLH